jgi:fructose-1,6-bisphosphatase/inositol monophosphatase family enzyme
MTDIRPNLKADPILRSVIQAVMAGGREVKRGQLGLVTGVVEKPDRTYVTAVDQASEAAALPYLRATGLRVGMEEGGFSGLLTDEEAHLDGTDGTRSLLNGLCTSTVIGNTYDTIYQEVTRCVIGEPATDTITFAGKGDGTWTFRPTCHPDDVEELDTQASLATRRYVWDEEKLPGKPTYYLDVTPTFEKPQHYDQPITPEGLGRLLYQMTAIQHWDLLLTGSNGMHHARVANGGFGARAAATIALGVPPDAAGGFLVEKAGGAVIGFKNGRRIKGLAVKEGDLFISANSLRSAEEFAKVVCECLYPELFPQT